MIKVQELRKQFGPFVAVDNISFTVSAGDVLGFLGPNGAGKSTTMKIITGFTNMTGGHVEICGYDVTKQPLQAKAAIGYLPEGAPAWPDMTPEQFLAFCGRARGLSGKTLDDAVDAAIDKVSLGSVLGQSIDTLSKGYKRRVGLAQAILHDPAVLILDEPTDGLDPNQKHEVRRLIRHMAKDKAIIISTHILEEVEALCNRTMIIDRGKMVADGNPSDLLKQSQRHGAVHLTINGGDAALIKDSLTSLDAVSRVEEIDGPVKFINLLIFGEGGEMLLDAVARLAQHQDWLVEGLSLERGRLEDVFRSLTMGDAA